MVLGIIPSLEGLSRKEAGEESVPCAFCMPTWTSINHHLPPDSQTFELGLNYTTNFPGSPVCRRQVLKLVSLYNHTGQFFVIHLHIYEGYIYHWFCSSGKRSLTEYETILKSVLSGTVNCENDDSGEQCNFKRCVSKSDLGPVKVKRRML